VSTIELDAGQDGAGIDEQDRPGGWWTVARRLLTGVFLLVTAAAVAVMLRGQDWSVLAATVRGRQPGFLAAMVGLALLANGVALLAAMRAWRWMLSGVSDTVTGISAARIFFAGQFAKYLPGKVFGLLVTIRMGKAAGVPAARMASAWLLTLVVGLLTGATVGLAAGPEVLGGSTGWLTLAALPIIAVLVRPEIIGWSAGLAARVRRRPVAAVGVPAKVIRRTVVTQLLSWLAGGAHLWFLAVAMGAAPARALPLCVGAFSVGAVAGMFAVFTPDGLGVREVILMSALGAVLPLPVAGVVALVSRLVVVLSELATAGVGLLATELLRRRSGQETAKARATIFASAAGRDDPR
jgi:hypothetical protein